MRILTIMLLMASVVSLAGCLEKSSDSSGSTTGNSSTQPKAPSNGNTESPSPNPNDNTPTPLPSAPIISCGTPDLTSPGFDCNGRSIYYPADQFVFRSVDAPHSILTEAQLDGANTILVCSIVGVSYCEQICVNQAFNFRHRYGLLYTGYIWPNSQCAYYIFQHNDESGLVHFDYFEGVYQAIENSVVGRCTNTDLAVPTLQGYYSFTETRVPEGQISPAPDHSRLYYSLEFLNLNQQPNGGYILSNYQPMFDSNVVYAFDRPFGNISVNFQQLAGFACVKKNEITPAVIDLIR